ncbi:Uncharacterized protein DBV15_03351 [Temnothorax longispinosus]|uniref:Uncharacterized protein n=1 Tax=Temnothorax longispinosus TaxID=300112 RepID=A0A4S2JQ89_9HYME|nr:Uncharacterized protein DBV15_03351 [Temnothorax longispinosus]
MLASDPANASDGTASIHRRRDGTRTFPDVYAIGNEFVEFRQLLSRAGREQFNLAGSFLAPIDGGCKIADARDPPTSDMRGYPHGVGRSTYVAAFNKACNSQTTEDADTWLVYGGPLIAPELRSRFPFTNSCISTGIAKFRGQRCRVGVTRLTYGKKWYTTQARNKQQWKVKINQDKVGKEIAEYADDRSSC